MGNAMLGIGTILRSCVLCAVAVLAVPAVLPTARAQNSTSRLDVWDIELGVHVDSLPVREFQDYACGTDGGPPGRRLASWTEFERCKPEPSGLYEVHFRYDDELEYRALAIRALGQVVRFEGTKVFGRPVIVSLLVAEDGIVDGLRIISDPRANLVQRQEAYTLRNILRSRFSSKGWSCADEEPDDRLEPIGRVFINQRCEKEVAGKSLTIETHYYRKRGQRAFDPATQVLTPGRFESSARFEMRRVGNAGGGK